MDLEKLLAALPVLEVVGKAISSINVKEPGLFNKVTMLSVKLLIEDAIDLISCLTTGVIKMVERAGSWGSLNQVMDSTHIYQSNLRVINSVMSFLESAKQAKVRFSSSFSSQLLMFRL
jgi:hypothetical protein